MPQQRLWQAVEALATNADPIQDRLYSAGQYLAPLAADDFDEAHREAFVAIKRALTAVDAVADEGTLRATTTAMSDSEAIEIAGKIFALDSAYRPLT